MILVASDSKPPLPQGSSARGLATEGSCAGSSSKRSPNVGDLLILKIYETAKLIEIKNVKEKRIKEERGEILASLD